MNNRMITKNSKVHKSLSGSWQNFMEIISGAQWNDCDLFYIQHSVYIIYIGLRCPAIIKESNMYGIHLLNSEAVGDCDNKI